ncbi:BZ3501_MvSof-1269-A2-R1_Chr5-1g07381 [Microbotryum saponariae]|nr:BZ3501_MvSof-1269-A2-R1_Chr5-1g07381 [Microbotryum saponariae]
MPSPLGWDDVHTDKPARPVTSVRCAMSARPNRAAPDMACEFKLGLQDMSEGRGGFGSRLRLRSRAKWRCNFRAGGPTSKAGLGRGWELFGASEEKSTKRAEKKEVHLIVSYNPDLRVPGVGVLATPRIPDFGAHVVRQESTAMYIIAKRGYKATTASNWVKVKPLRAKSAAQIKTRRAPNADSNGR